MQLTLTKEIEALVEEQLATGAFASAEEVVLRALEYMPLEATWDEAERKRISALLEERYQASLSGITHTPSEAGIRLAARKDNWLKNRPLG